MTNTEEIEEFNFEMGVEIASILQKKAELKAIEEDKSQKEIKQAGQKAFNKSIRKKAVEFLKKIEQRIEELSNKEVAQLLQALIAMGLSIEDEEELEYWINLLEREATRRIAVYFSDREGMKAAPKHKKKFAKKTFDLSLDEMKALSTIAEAVNKSMQRKRPSNEKSEEYKRFLEREKFIKKLEETIKEDTQKRQQEKTAEKELAKSKDIKKNKENKKGKENKNNQEDKENLSDKEKEKLEKEKKEKVKEKEEKERKEKEKEEKEKAEKEKIEELRGIESKDAAKKEIEKSEGREREDAQKQKTYSRPSNVNSGHSGGR